MIVFTGGGVIDTNKMTIVLTHGWIPSWESSGAVGSDGWPSSLYQVLKAGGYEAIANIVAWDWREDATKLLAHNRSLAYA